jgi:DNA-directed RNA polymerase subunit RPC12/RpoP
MLTIECPQCGKDHDWPDDWVGDRVDCPSCGKVFTLERPRRGRRDDDEEDERRVSSRRHYDDEDDDRGRRRSFRRDEDEDRRGRARDGSRKEITCPRCDYVGRPRLNKEMAENALLFIILGIFFLPLLILGVLMKDTWEVCPECGKKLRKVGGMTFG